MNFELLRRIVETPGAPGFEDPIRNLLIEELKDRVDDWQIDGIGNLIVRKQGNGPKVMAAAHMDEISLITTYVDDNGFVRFSTLGGFDPSALVNQRVYVHGDKTLPGVIGSKPIHAQSDEEKKQPPKLDSLYIDVGLPADDVKKLVAEGTPVTRATELWHMGNCITGKSLDNRISVYMLLEALNEVEELNIDFYGVFTTQEELGLRGARVAANAIRPAIGLALDITLANDLPSVNKQDYCTRIGEGPAVKILDKSVMATPTLVEFIQGVAREAHIPLQREVLTAGGTDTSAMQYLMGLGTHVTCLSIPTRYVHTTVETAAEKDIDQGIRLLVETLQSLHTYNALP